MVFCTMLMLLLLLFFPFHCCCRCCYSCIVDIDTAVDAADSCTHIDLVVVVDTAVVISVRLLLF